MEKDLDDSIDISSTSNDGSTEIPAVIVTNELASMSTFDDVDDDEAFICDLMAMHPNDDDIVVEDLEEEIDQIDPPSVEMHDVAEGEEATEDGVRLDKCSWLCSYRSLLLNSYSPGRFAPLRSLLNARFSFNFFLFHNFFFINLRLILYPSSTSRMKSVFIRMTQMSTTCR